MDTYIALFGKKKKTSADIQFLTFINVILIYMVYFKS